MSDSEYGRSAEDAAYAAAADEPPVKLKPTEYRSDQAGRIRCLRGYLGMSVSEMAATLKVSDRSYQNFESGRMQIPAGVMADMADLVHQLDELAGRYAECDEVNIRDLPQFEFRAVSIAAAAKPELRILP